MSREEEQGLFAMTSAEAARMVSWYYAAADAQQIDDSDILLAARVREWGIRRREGPVSLHGG